MRSTIGQLRDFHGSSIWTDIVEELDIWLDQIHGQLENHGLEADHRELDRLGGSAEAIRNFKDIITVLIGIVEDNKAQREIALKNLKGGN